VGRGAAAAEPPASCAGLAARAKSGSWRNPSLPLRLMQEVQPLGADRRQMLQMLLASAALLQPAPAALAAAAGQEVVPVSRALAPAPGCCSSQAWACVPRPAAARAAAGAALSHLPCSAPLALQEGNALLLNSEQAANLTAADKQVRGQRCCTAPGARPGPTAGARTAAACLPAARPSCCRWACATTSSAAASRASQAPLAALPRPARLQVLTLNRRIQKQNQAPLDFPAFVREGFDIKIIADGFVLDDSGWAAGRGGVWCGGAIAGRLRVGCRVGKRQGWWAGGAAD
jgi:hypothetical protein